jgi:hypothetical protein
MKKQFLYPLAGALMLGLIVPVGAACGEPISLKYAGTGYDTSVDNFLDGLPVNISLAEAKGSFGAKRVEISAEFDPINLDDHPGCADGYDIAVGLLYSASVATFSDQSQLFGFSDQGWMCANSQNGHYYGEVYGVYGGGTKRFADASGTWMSAFEGNDLEPPHCSR